MNTVHTPTVMASFVEMLLTSRCWVSLWKDEYSADFNSQDKSFRNVAYKQMLNKSLKGEYSSDPKGFGKFCSNVADKQMLSKSLKVVAELIKCRAPSPWVFCLANQVE